MPYKLSAYITNEGLAELNRLAVIGQPLVVNRSAVGNGIISYSSEEERAIISAERTDLVSFVMDASVLKVENVDAYYNVVIQVTNAALAIPVDIWEAGLYCVNGVGQTILFCYLQFGDYKDTIMDSTVPIYYREYTVTLQIGNTQVEVKVSPEALTKQADFLAHKNDYNNPHQVNADQLTSGTLDCGYFTEDIVAAHNMDAYAHAIMSVDGNAEGVSIVGDLESHMVDPAAHPNLTVDGNVG